MPSVAKLDENSRPTLTAVSSLDGSSIVDLWADPITHRLLTDASSSGSFQIPTSGVVNGSNTTFTWTSAPVVIVRDGISMQKVSIDGTVNWTGTTTTVLTIAPNSDIFSSTPASSGGGGSLTAEVPTGTVNSINTVFTVTHTPVVLVVDGIVLDLASGDYSYLAGTITVVSPPTRFITSYHN